MTTTNRDPGTHAPDAAPAATTSHSSDPIAAPDPDAALSLRGLRKSYGPVRALDGVDLTIRPGEILALLGPNGAGKSTCMEMMVGLAKPDSGTVHVHGMDPVTATRSGIIRAMLQSGALLPDQKVRSMLKMLHSLQARPMPLAKAVEQADIGDLMGRRIDRLSGGQAQRVRFAIALLGDPDVLLLDEPTVGMDVTARRAFWHRMREVAATGRTIVFATHHLEEAEREAARVVVMDRGRIVADGNAETVSALVAGRVLTLRGADAHLVAELPGVDMAAPDEADPGRVRAVCSDADLALRALFTSPLAEQVHDVLVSAPGLEEAFMHITDHSDENTAANAAAQNAAPTPAAHTVTEGAQR
ncbi:ABC transporter ATP-binding protein [Brachybacterium muris]|uniref:ABC transporter ATP-binding protein n=1 Tax=Brachybacterium muris TaxID=219301 RepID=UPI00195ED66D|nr:ABC transporter ATP-binding protein [Brachybacterium muris]MBM7499461.1 ABC-2 type transport system ATP-binding protein [Brachybacterium muris]MCT1999384.1 ABC transporter ATP-binding protein [Brachybacterium muris]